ncbi:MAG: TolC family protein [Armatimonadetes bacterium]|nr:TolC family protein [Armatimonadota bacterium]
MKHRLTLPLIELFGSLLRLSCINMKPKSVFAALVVIALWLSASVLGMPEAPVLPPRPLTLSEAIRIALERHPTIISAQKAYEASLARIDETGTPLNPKVNSDAGYSQRGGSSTTSSTSWSAQTTLRQTLTDFGKTAASVRRSSALAESFREAEVLARQAVILKVAEAFYGVLQTRELVDVAVSAVTQQERHLHQAEEFFRVGTRARIEVTKAQVDLSRAKLDQVKAENQLRQRKVDLGVAMGLRSEDSGEPVRGQDKEGEKAAPALSQALETAFSSRPEILESKARLEAAKGGLQVAESGLLPALSGVAGYGWDESVFVPRANSWQLGMTLSIPVFDGNLTRHQIRENRALVEQAQADLENQHLLVRQDVEQQMLAYKEALERLKVATEAERQALENFDLAKRRYEVGVGSSLEFTDAQVALSRAQSDAIQAFYDSKTAYSRLEKSMGVLGQ